MPLTDIQIRSAKPTEKPQRLFDGGGMYLEIAPSGGKLWRMKYRFGGKEKRLALGTYPDVSLKDARAKRDDARKLLANDVDPGEHRKAVKQSKAISTANSFEIVAREWFSKNNPNWVENHGNRIIRRLERDIFPWLGNKPISDIKAPALLEVIRRIEDRGATHTAHRALANCGQIFRYAIATGRAERDPSSDLKGALPPTKVKHFAAVTEPEKVAKLLRSLDVYQGNGIVCWALKLAPLTFVRPGELRRARWEDIDFERSEWRFFVSKTEVQHIVPLANQAMAIFRELQPLTGHGVYVFPNARTRDGSRPMSDNAVLSAMRNLGITKEEMSGHGFRAMARTLMDEELQTRPDFMEHQLAHAVKDPLGRAYNRTTHLQERHIMMQKWADYLDNLKQGNNVVLANFSH